MSNIVLNKIPSPVTELSAYHSCDLRNDGFYDNFSTGPFVRGCRGGFDFKIGFEFVFLLWPLQAVFALTAVARCIYIARKRKVAVVSGWRLLIAKQFLNLLYIWTEAAAVDRWTRYNYGHDLDLVTQAYQISRVACCLAFLALAPLSYLDHRRTLRPSSVICIFLGIGLVLDLVHLRSIILTPPIVEECAPGSISLQVVACAIKFFQLCAESTHKTRWVLNSGSDKTVSAEDWHGVFSRMLLLWVNPVVWRASRKTALVKSDMYELPQSLSASHLDRSFRQTWRTVRKDKHGIRAKGGLRNITFQALKRLYLEPVIPRLVLLVFTLLQPLLVRRMLEYLQAQTDTPDLALGYSITAAFVFVYLAIAFLSALLWAQRSRLYTAIRGLLQTEIYRKTTKIPAEKRRSEDPKDLEASIEQIAGIGRDVHEVWANAIQTYVTTAMLFDEIEYGCFAPAILYVTAFAASIPLKAWRKRLEKRWEETKRERTTLLIDLAQSSRAAKFLGLGTPIAELVRRARGKEFEALRSLQMTDLACSAVAILPAVLSPPAAFGLYLATYFDAASEVNLTKIFTSMSVLLLLCRALSAEIELLYRVGSTSPAFAHLDRFLEIQNRTADETGDSTAEQIGADQTQSSGRTAQDISLLAEATPSHQEEGERPATLPTQPGYRKYLQKLGVFPIATLLLIGLVCGFLVTFPYIWLSWWAEGGQELRDNSSDFFVGVYTALQVGVAIVPLAGAWLVTFLARHGASRRAFEELADAVISAPAGFHDQAVSSLSNLLKHEVDVIDTQIPRRLLEFDQSLFVVIGQATLVAFISPWMALVFVALTPVYVGAEKMLIKTRRDVHSLHQEATRDLNAHLAHIFSSQGAATEQEQQDQQTRNKMHIDTAQRPHYLLMLTRGLLHLILDVVTALVVAAVTTLLVHYRGQVANGIAAIALTVLVSFSSGRHRVVEWKGDLDISLESVTRVQTALDASHNENLSTENRTSPAHWPTRGTIEFNDVGMMGRERLGDEAPADGATPLLQNVNLRIEHGQKVAVCGDRGSGKSSVVDAIMRMRELSSGSVLVGDLDIATLPKEAVRSAIIGFGKDTYLIAGSIRLNLDPTGQFSDSEAELHRAIDLVQLSGPVTSLGGLDATITPDVFSVEQVRLLSLARATLRRSNVVVLDRIASKVDAATAALIQKIVHDEWRHSTVIEVLDDVNNVTEYDVAVVMHQGEVIEVDRPATLLSRETVLAKMYAAQQAEP